MVDSLWVAPSHSASPPTAAEGGSAPTTHLPTRPWKGAEGMDWAHRGDVAVPAGMGLGHAWLQGPAVQHQEGLQGTAISLPGQGTLPRGRTESGVG